MSRPFSYQYNPLHAWHPKKYENYWYTPRNLDTKGSFVHLEGGNYALVISSPSSGSGFREYDLTIPPAFQDLDETRIRGHFGEHESRILLKELLRQSQEVTDINMFRFLKSPEDIPTLLKKKYSGRFDHTYNLLLHNDTLHQTTTDFDGVLQYRVPHRPRKQEGYIIVEAKTGKLERTIATEKNRRTIMDKVIDPIMDLFPDDPVDYFLMGDLDKIYVADVKRRRNKEMRPELGRFVKLLADYNIGCIIQAFPHSKKSIVDAAQDMVFMEKSRRDAETVLGKLEFATTGIYSQKDYRFHMVDGEVTAIYRKIGNNTFMEIKI
jgi:hypothetical protein